jgi:nucleotide-binding universal stress UspA family protein
MVEFDEILVPVDGSEGAQRAAVLAGRLASATGASLKFVHVVGLTTDTIIALAKLTKEQIHAAHAEAAKGVLAQAQSALAASGAGIAADTLVLVGDPAQEILDYLETHPRTMVVMGRRGLSAIRGLMLGSVSEKVARHAVGPVTLVH